MSLSTPITTKSALEGARGVARVTRPMVVTLILLVSFPLWAEAVGLYTYLGVEVVIWMIYALYGLCSHGITHNPLISLLCAGCAGGMAAALVACFISHRRGIYFALMTIAWGQVFWFVSMKWHSLTGGEDGLLNIHRSQTDIGPLRGRSSSTYRSSRRAVH